jgi:hypothetical protein
MRNPLHKALWSIGLVLLGAGLALLGYALQDRIGTTAAGILGIIGLAFVPIFLFTFLWALTSAIGYSRLMSGKNVIARWHVSASDWDRFRAYDKIRAEEHLALRNDIRIRKKTPLQGVDVIVGRHSIIVDGSYHHISGKPVAGRRINWINAPVDPECIEFPKTYSRGKSGTLELTLRVPVPAAARAEGVKVWEFYVPKAKS